MTDSQGNVISRRDFKPFGEEITNNTGERTTTAKYGVADNLKQKFTTYQRDEESGLDFAEARMYENRHGRFTAVDPLLASGKNSNPQTFNRYVYVGNNPVNVTDPSGLDWCVGGDGEATFAGAGVKCTKGEVTVTRAVAVDPGYDANGVRVQVGDWVNLHPDGRVTVDRPLNNQDVSDAGVRNASDPGSTVTVDAPTGEVGSAINKRQTDPEPDLGCPEERDSACGSGNHVSQSLVEGASAEEVLESAQIALDVASSTEIPVVSQAAGLVNAGIDAGRGDFTSAGLGIVGVVPLAGNWADAARLTNRLRKIGAASDKLADGVEFTKSSLSFGQQIHKAYKEAEVLEGVAVKEFRGITGIRPDFVDFSSRTIYELKPFNPRGIKSGTKQLKKYQELFQKQYPGSPWKTVLETY